MFFLHFFCHQILYYLFTYYFQDQQLHIVHLPFVTHLEFFVVFLDFGMTIACFCGFWGSIPMTVVVSPQADDGEITSIAEAPEM